MRRNLPPEELFLGKTIDRFPNHVIQEHIASGNNGHLFRAFDSSTEGNLAFKIVPFDNLPDDKDEQQTYLTEAKKANVLQHSSVINYIDVVPYFDSNSSLKCVVFVCDYVEGKNLREYMKQHRVDINIQFVEAFLRTMLELLHELKHRGYQHGDLHAGNVLVSRPEFDIYGRTVFRVTDFGIQELTGQVAHASDYLSIAQILGQLLDCIEFRDCEGRDRYAYRILRDDFLKRHLIETDMSADPLACNPLAMFERLDSVGDAYREAGRELINAKLVTPFDYPNCEQMGNSHLLLKNLYSDRLLGLAEIHKRANLMLTGPRGCGKTTVFRALSLDYLTSTNDDRPDNLDYIGIYYRCDDLYFAFPRYKLPERQEALDVPMHFLIVTLLATTLEQVAIWAKKHFSNEFEKKEEILVADLWNLLELNPPDNPSANQLATLVIRLKGRERKRAADKQRFVHQPDVPIRNYFGPGIMVDACRLIRKKFSFLHDRPFYFFIDDYSHPKITTDLQANLNRLLMYRSPDIFFKLSTESPVSFVRQDVDGKQFTESREYDFINLGLRYLTDKSKKTLEFLEDLFNRRFYEVEGYPVQTLEELLGSVPRNENATACAIREKKELQKHNYAGCETVAAMCSGDIHYMIRLVARMVEDLGGTSRLAESDKTPRIPEQDQHNSIRAAAGAFMESVRTLPRCGPKLTEVVTAFGTVAHSYLQYATSTNEVSEPPHQASRLEPYEALKLSEEAQQLLNELLRYSILIEDPRGKSRRGKVVPRFYLRRYLIPHFRLTFSRRDSLQLENREIEALLCNPEKFEDSMRLKSKDDAIRRRRQNPDQEELFPDE